MRAKSITLVSGGSVGRTVGFFAAIIKKSEKESRRDRSIRPREIRVRCQRSLKRGI